MSRKLLLEEGTIRNCKCRVACDSEHHHTLEHGNDGVPGASGPKVYDVERYYPRYHLGEQPTHKVTIACQCALSLNGVRQNTEPHVHVHSTGPTGLSGLKGGILRDNEPDLGRSDRRFFVIIKDCHSCLKEAEPHDHAILEGLRGARGLTTK